MEKKGIRAPHSTARLRGDEKIVVMNWVNASKPKNRVRGQVFFFLGVAGKEVRRRSHHGDEMERRVSLQYMVLSHGWM
jgi:hypothetical protein